MIARETLSLRMSGELADMVKQAAKANHISTSELMRWCIASTLNSSEGYEFPSTEKWRKAVKERDNYTCQECGETCAFLLRSHHILPSFEGGKNTLSNGRTLCKKCHAIQHALYRQPKPDQKPLEIQDIQSYQDALTFTRKGRSVNVGDAVKLCRNLGIDVPPYVNRFQNYG